MSDEKTVFNFYGDQSGNIIGQNVTNATINNTNNTFSEKEQVKKGIDDLLTSLRQLDHPVTETAEFQSVLDSLEMNQVRLTQGKEVTEVKTNLNKVLSQYEHIFSGVAMVSGSISMLMDLLK